MGWPLNTVESLGSFSVGRYGAPLWLEGRLRLTAGQSGEAPDEVPGSCRSLGPAIGHQRPVTSVSQFGRRRGLGRLLSGIASALLGSGRLGQKRSSANARFRQAYSQSGGVK